MQAARGANAACIAAFTATGKSALRLARERPLSPTLALSPFIATARRLALAWGIEPRLVADIRDPEEMPEVACRQALQSGLAEPGDVIVILAGIPMGSPGAANLLRLVHTRRPSGGRVHLADTPDQPDEVVTYL